MSFLMAFALMGANEAQMRTMLLSVGSLFLLLAIALAFGLRAWSKKHGVLGWLTRILAAVVGGLAGMMCSLVLDAVPKHVQSSLPDFAIGVFILAFVLLGSWLALRLVNSFSGRQT